MGCKAQTSLTVCNTAAPPNTTHAFCARAQTLNRPRTPPLHPLPASLMPAPTSFARRRWLRVLACAAAILAALPLMAWALLRAALAPQAGEWAVTLGSGPWAIRASAVQLAWLGTSPWLGPQLDGLQLRTRYGPLDIAWLPARGKGLNEAPILILHCEPCALPLPAAGRPAHALRLPAVQLALMRDRVQHLRGTLMLGANPLTAPPASDSLPASPQPPLITLWWQADRAPEQDGRGWLLRLHGPAIPVQDWLALLGAPGSGKTSGTLALDAELPMPGPASAWRVRWRHDGPSPLPVRAFPAFLQTWLTRPASAPPSLPAPALPAGEDDDAGSAPA